MTEATLKHCKDTLTTEKKSLESQQKTLEEDRFLLKEKQSEMDKGLGEYEDMQARSKAAENAVLTAQQHFQAVSAGLSSGADGQEETLAAQKIGKC